MSDFSDVVSAPPGRFDGIKRPYDAAEVKRLRGSVPIDHTLARRGALKLWELLNRQEEPVRALGAVTGNQAMQMVRAGLQAIYLSGWPMPGRSSHGGSTARCSAPTRSRPWRAAPSATGLYPSSRMLKQGSAGR
jgi:isocitrate lyase